ETEAEALRRELKEEAGLAPVDVGQCLWTSEFVFPARAGWWKQRERVHLVRVRGAEVAVPDLSHENVHGHRWWCVEELERTEEILAPRRLPELVRTLLADGPPREPID